MIDLERAKVKRPRVHFFPKRKLSPAVARFADFVAVGAALVTVWGLFLLAKGQPAHAAAIVPPSTSYVEQFTLDGRLLGRWELAGEPRNIAAGVCAFQTIDGRRLFVAGNWRVVTTPGE